LTKKILLGNLTTAKTAKSNFAVNSLLSEL